MLNSVKVQGFVTEDGRLELQLPPDAPRGAVEVVITAEAHPPAKVYPTGAEIAAELESGALGGWEDDGTDSVEFVQRLRQARRERIWGRHSEDS